MSSSSASAQREPFRGFADIPSSDLKVFEGRKFKLLHVFGRREHKRRYVQVQCLDQGGGVLEVYKVAVDSRGASCRGQLSFVLQLPQGKIRKGKPLSASSLASTVRQRRELSIELVDSVLPNMRFYPQTADELGAFHRSLRDVTVARKAKPVSAGSIPSSIPSSGSVEFGREVAMSADRLQAMRSQSDDIGDNCFRALQTLGVGVDTFVDAISFRVENNGLVAAWRRVPAIDAFLREVYTPPAYVDAAELTEGQMVFLRNSSVAFMALLYYSLIGGFSAPDIVKVLDATAYMTKDEARTWRRLNETTEFVLDCVQAPGCLGVGGGGWRAALKVRFIHCRVRAMLLKRDPPWDTLRQGPPINQEHLMGTLLSFSVNIVEAVGRHGKPLTAREEVAYLHLWRYIGHLLGVQEDSNPLGSPAEARAAMDAVVLHLLKPDARSAALAAHVLRSVSDREPFWWSYRCHCECARRMLGDELADALRIERSSSCALYVALVFWLIYLVSALLSRRMTSHAHRGVVRTQRIIRQLVNRAIGKERA